MKIRKQLKYGSFEWDDEAKTFKVTQGGQSVELSKIYAFAFVRFALRIAQRNWFRKLTSTKVTIQKANEDVSNQSIDDDIEVLEFDASKENKDIGQYELL